MIRKQLELVPLLCPCISRNYATHARSSPLTKVPRRREYVEGSSRSITTPDDYTRDQGPRLPRYIRRTPGPSSSTTPKTNDAASPPRVTPHGSTFRSRHYNPSQSDEAKSKIRLLEPHVLSSRLRKLCDANQIDAAVSLLKNAPLDAQNTPVWNTLMWECMKAKRFKLAYQLFIDMKRRGFSPTTRTFQTMFTGLSRIEHWSNHPKQLENARSIYDSFQRYLAAIKNANSDSPELSVNPFAAYITILGNAGHYQDIFDVYYTMDSEGPLAPNQFIFTAMFQALSTKNDSSGILNPTIKVKNAAGARLLWDQMQKASLKPPGFEVDGFIITSALTTLSHGRPADQAFAFEIVHRYFGLEKPGKPPSNGIVPLVPQSLAAVFMLCNTSQEHALCDYFFQQVKRRPDAFGGVSILDRGHLEEVLKARLSLPAGGSAHYALETLEWMLRQEITGRNGPKIRPAITTYNLVMTACWRDGDWKSATRTFELMTGYHAHDFMDGAVADAPRLDKRASGRNLAPTAETISSMIRAAYTTRDRANVRQCLRIIDHLGVDYLLTPKVGADEPHKASKSRLFYGAKLASSLVDSISFVLDHSVGGRVSQDEASRWRKLASSAEKTLKRVPTSQFVPAADEEQPRERKRNFRDVEPNYGPRR